jgi:hypothetical protein
MSLDWVQVSAAAGAGGAVVGVAIKFWDFFEKVFKTIFGLAKGKPKTAVAIPKQTVIPQVEARITSLIWSEGNSGGTPPIPMMQVVADLHLTNVWTGEVKIVAARFRFKKNFFLRKTVIGEAFVKDTQSQFSGHYPIPQGVMTTARIHFISPWSRYPKGHLKGDVSVIDQFGNHHWLRKLVFKAPGKLIEAE